ncbi:MAG: helix-turn-helix domain-containing protein, partial [Fuerstiella sp.]
RIGFNSHHGFVELGAFTTKQLRQTRSIEFHAWTSPKAIKEAKSKPKPKRDPLRLARYYQSLLDTGTFESRAALARHLGVSRARVTQVLNRFKDADDGGAKSA